jgi:glycosyltransferase involved in cell wall biosynthesis
MHIVQIMPGAGSRFYCENCARDDSLERGLRARDHTVTRGSLYLPRSGEHSDASAPVPLFYSAVGLYLRHRFPVLRNLPPWINRLFDTEILLHLAGSMSGATDAAGLEELTLSMLQGEEGEQAQELDRLVRWLSQVRPDIVHLSNCLLVGIARRVRRELGIPVVCSLQDEDTWIDSLSGDSRVAAWELLRERSAEVELFLPVSRYYSSFMSRRLSLPESCFAVVPIGIETEGFPREPGELPWDPPVIGFLSHICRSMGADILAEAFILLCREERWRRLRLRFAGGSTGADISFLRSIRRRLTQEGLSERVDFVRSFARPDRLRFLASLSVLSVPVRGGEAFGTFILEALAAGVPVIQPRLGGFPELIESTQGGVLYEPNTPEALAAALEGLLADRLRAQELGRRGGQAVTAGYTAGHMAARLEEIFQNVLVSNGRTPS